MCILKHFVISRKLFKMDTQSNTELQVAVTILNIYIYHRFIVRFPMGLYVVFITYLLHFFWPWMFSL